MGGNSSLGQNLAGEPGLSFAKASLKNRKMKYSRKCMVCNKEVIASNKRTFVHPECKDRPTPPVEAKTAEEILVEVVGMDLETLHADGGKIYYENALDAMHAYHAQFTSSAKSVEVEEAEWINPDQQLNGADFLIEVNKILKTYPNTSSIKIVKLYIKQQQKQADTISRLEDRIKDLEGYLTISTTSREFNKTRVKEMSEVLEKILTGNLSYTHIMKLAKEALKEK
jgi:hypothetical protein